MSGSRQARSSDLFLVRVWAREASDGEIEWQGKVQRAVSGEAYYFQDLPQLPELLRSMMPGGPAGKEAQTPGTDADTDRA